MYIHTYRSYIHTYTHTYIHTLKQIPSTFRRFTAAGVHHDMIMWIHIIRTTITYRLYRDVCMRACTLCIHTCT